MRDTIPDLWRTRVAPTIATRFGVHELHAVFFEPAGERTRKGSGVIILRIDETPAYEIAEYLEAATETETHVGFLCDTRQQANEILRRAGKMLPNHRRMALERAEACEWNRW